MSSPANPTVRHYRFCTPITGAAHESYALVGTEDASFEITLDTDYCLIIKVGNDGQMSAAGDFQLQLDIDSAGFLDINATSAGVRAANSGDTDGATSVVERLGTSAQTYVGSVLDEVDCVIQTNIGGGDEYEFYFAINFRSAELSGGESLEFRLLTGGATFTHNVSILATVPSAAPSGTVKSIIDVASQVDSQKGGEGAPSSVINPASQVDSQKGATSSASAIIDVLTKVAESANRQALVNSIIDLAAIVIGTTGAEAKTGIVEAIINVRSVVASQKNAQGVNRVIADLVSTAIESAGRSGDADVVIDLLARVSEQANRTGYPELIIDIPDQVEGLAQRLGVAESLVGVRVTANFFAGTGAETIHTIALDGIFDITHAVPGVFDTTHPLTGEV